LFSGCRGGGAPLLDKQALLERFDWWDNRDWDWYAQNIPFFESPDPELDATYYYRWEVLTKHLVYGSPETGYTFTEFIDRPFWSGSFGGISCPLGHQAYEIRWLKSRRIIEDFARYWFETPGAEPRSYSNWYGDAMWATYSVTGDRAFLGTVYPHMETQVEGWTAERWDPNHEMFRWVGAWDGMETNINSRLTDDHFGGAEGYRPTLNSYLFADLMALSKTADLFGEDEKARDYGLRAEALKTRVQEELWDPEREFFLHQFAFDEKDGIRAKSLTYETGPYAGDPHGRELLGFVPWQFNLPDPGYEAAWSFLMAHRCGTGRPPVLRLPTELHLERECVALRDHPNLGGSGQPSERLRPERGGSGRLLSSVDDVLLESPDGWPAVHRRGFRSLFRFLGRPQRLLPLGALPPLGFRGPRHQRVGGDQTSG
jgi:hypothetical protein